MILVKTTIDGTLHRVSNEVLSLDHLWYPYVISISNPMMSLPTDHGGWCRMTAGDIVFAPKLFDDDWPPPKTIDVEIDYTATTEAAATTIISGTAIRREIDYKSVTYTLKQPDYDETVSDGTVYNDTLNNVMTTILTGISEISTVNTSNARATSPSVNFTTSGDQLNIELASKIVSSYTHLFYIDGSTAYLVDMKSYVDTHDLTEYQFFPPKYWDKEPIASVKEITTGNDYTRFSSYPQGVEMTVDVYHSTEANINTALDDIITIENRVRCSVRIPMAEAIPSPGDRIRFNDTRTRNDLSVNIRARVFRYDLNRGMINVEGEGWIT